MPDEHDPYREALVIETKTIWPKEYDDIDGAEKQRIAQALHAVAEDAGHLEYVRQHTGFCRQITVTAEDIERLKRRK